MLMSATALMPHHSNRMHSIFLQIICDASSAKCQPTHSRTHTHPKTGPNLIFNYVSVINLFDIINFGFCFEHPFLPKMPPSIFLLCAYSFDFCFVTFLLGAPVRFIFCFVCVECCWWCLYKQHHSFFRCSLLRWHNGSDCATVCQWFAAEPAEGNLINNFIKQFCWNTMCYATRNFHCAVAFVYGHQIAEHDRWKRLSVT